MNPESTTAIDFPVSHVRVFVCMYWRAPNQIYWIGKWKMANKSIIRIFCFVCIADVVVVVGIFILFIWFLREAHI